MRIRVLRAYYAMFLSRYVARQNAYKTQLLQETFVYTIVAGVNVTRKSYMVQLHIDMIFGGV